jgi:hypothetical protein
MERVIGPDYPHTLASRNNLAAAYHVVGQLTEAIPCSCGQLADRERVLGPDHSHTLTSRINPPAPTSQRVASPRRSRCSTGR